MNEVQKTPATSILRKPIPAPFAWIALILGFVMLLAGSPQSAFRLFARAMVYGLVVLMIRSCRKLFSSKNK